MIAKTIDFVYFFRRSVDFHKRCMLLSRATSTSMSWQKVEVKNSKGKTLNAKFPVDDGEKYEDTFGNLENFEIAFQRTKDDPEDVKECQRERKAQGKTVSQYLKEIKSYLESYDYKSALKVLEVDMVNDRKPTNVLIYKILMSYNARIGNLEEAYRLFVNYKKRQGLVTGAMYTSLFNACANCKSSFFALEKANAVRECMRNNKNHVINASNYNSMMKAYGRHGDIVTCLEIMDEILYKRDKVQSESYSFLIQACVSDKNSGLRHALIVWRKMLQNRVKPSIFLFNLLLRCIRECSLGETLLIPNLIEEIQSESGKFFRRKVVIETKFDKKQRTVLKIPSDGRDLIIPEESEDKTVKTYMIEVNSLKQKEPDELTSKNCQLLSNNFSINEDLNCQSGQLDLQENEVDSSKTVEMFSSAAATSKEKEQWKNELEVKLLHDESELPNLIAFQPSTGSVIKFGVMTEPHYRFMLVGGVKGFLKTMSEFGVKPDIKTFTLMLDVVPSNLEAEQKVLSLVKAYKIPLDTAFFNVLMKRRFLRNEDSSAKDCLRQMHTLNLRPDLLTFGILALGCRTCESGKELLWNIKNCGYKVNTEILHSLLRNAKVARDLSYVSAILQEAKESEVQVCQKFLTSLSEFVRSERRLGKTGKQFNERLVADAADIAADLPSS